MNEVRERQLEFFDAGPPLAVLGDVAEEAGDEQTAALCRKLTATDLDENTLFVKDRPQGSPDLAPGAQV